MPSRVVCRRDPIGHVSLLSGGLVDGSAYFKTYRRLDINSTASLNGSECMPSANWSSCFACAGSTLERRCGNRDWQPYCDEPKAIRRAKGLGYMSERHVRIRGRGGNGEEFQSVRAGGLSEVKQSVLVAPYEGS